MNPTFKFLIFAILFAGTLLSCGGSGSSSANDGPYERKMKNRKYEKQLMKYFNEWNAKSDLRYKACIIESPEFQYDREYGNIVSRWLSVIMLGKNKKTGECKHDGYTVEQIKTPNGWSKEWRRRSSGTYKTIPCDIMNKYK